MAPAPVPPPRPPPSKKRKDPPTKPTHQPPPKKPSHPPNPHQSRTRDARTLATQTSSKALANGALDVDKFVRAREFEIAALEEGMRRSGKALTQRAFQLVPFELRRRGASHDVRRMPGRLRGRGGREMKEDKTPVRKGKKITGHMRLRLETVKKLRAMGARRKGGGEGGEGGRGKMGEASKDVEMEDGDVAAPRKKKAASEIQTRPSKIKKATLANPPLPKARFRKRQRAKCWLPTHLYHAKRAHMAPPSAPLWGFSIPMTPSQKSYRPTHRAARERGAVAWDMSYISTIGIEGEERSLTGMLTQLGADPTRGKNGTRAQGVFLHARDAPHKILAPATIIWCVVEDAEKRSDRSKRQIFLRVHPSSFRAVWDEIVSLSKVMKPGLKVEDLRYEIGSIEITGPGSTEALHGALKLAPAPGKAAGAAGNASECVSASVFEPSLQPTTAAKTWGELVGLTNPAVLPEGVVMGLDVQDPRPHHPPQPIQIPQGAEQQMRLVEMTAEWPLDTKPTLPRIFDRRARIVGSQLPSQSTVNRRRGAASLDGPAPAESHVSIPVLLHTATPRDGRGQQSSWTLLAPWKTIQPLWYSLMYYPLSTGKQPSLGGLDELRQVCYEAGRPWFPGDFPGTAAGWDWELYQRTQRWTQWQKRPKGKRVNWAKVDLGGGRVGEVGDGWACDWSLLLPARAPEGGVKTTDAPKEGASTEKPQPPPSPPKPDILTHIPSEHALDLLKTNTLPPRDLFGKLFTVKLTLVSRGVPNPCARIYRLPARDAALATAWKTLHRTTSTAAQRSQNKKNPRPPPFQDLPPSRRLGASLLNPKSEQEDERPACPGEEDLIGFVTTGNFNLAEGKGTAVGCLALDRVVGAMGEREWRPVCVVRDAGEGVARMGRWEIV